MAKRSTKAGSKPALLLNDIPLPLRVAEGGVVRVGKSRVPLDLVVEQYESGVTPEDLVRDYDTLELADVHATIAYYLRHREAVIDYMQRRAKEAAKLRREIEAGRPHAIKESLQDRAERLILSASQAR